MELPTAIVESIKKDVDQLAEQATTAVLRAKEARLIGDLAAPTEAEELNRYRTEAGIWSQSTCWR